MWLADLEKLTATIDLLRNSIHSLKSLFSRRFSPYLLTYFSSRLRRYGHFRKAEIKNPQKNLRFFRYKANYARGLILFSFCVLLSAQEPPFSVREGIDRIPSEDQEILSSFFRGLLSKGEFAAVLLGNKPATLQDCGIWWCVRAPMPLRTKFLLLYQGWQTWNKYAYLFRTGKYRFIDAGYATVTSAKRRLGVCNWWFGKETHYKQMSLCSQFTQPLTIQQDEDLGGVLGYPKEGIESFCEKERLEFTLSFFPYDIALPLLGSNTTYTPLDLLDGYPLDLTQKYTHLLKNLPLYTIPFPEEPFFPTIPYGCASPPPLNPLEEPDLDAKIIRLYNSDHFLEEILTLISTQ